MRSPAAGAARKGEIKPSEIRKPLLLENGGLPKTIVYTLNPKDYYAIGTLIGCFQGLSLLRMTSTTCMMVCMTGMLRT